MKRLRKNKGNPYIGLRGRRLIDAITASVYVKHHAPVQKNHRRVKQMASYKTYDNLPDIDQMIREARHTSTVYDMFYRAANGNSYMNIAMVWNALCNTSCFESDEAFRDTVLPIAAMLIRSASLRGHKSGMSPSFQAQLARLVRQHYPTIRGRAA